MLRQLTIEWMKQRRSLPIWIMLSLYVLCYVIAGFASYKVIDAILHDGPVDQLIIDQMGIPLFDWVDIWANVGWASHLFKYLLAFIVILSICNEFNWRTARQHIIDGMSRREWYGGKLILITALSVGGMLVMGLLALWLGLLYSPVQGSKFMLYNISWIGGYGLELFGFLLLAAVFSLLIRKTGFTIVLFTMYSMFIEPALSAFLHFKYELWVDWMPIKATQGIIRMPVQKYGLMLADTHPNPVYMLQASIWCLLLIAIGWWLFNRRDL